MVIVMVKLIKYSRNVVFKYLLLFQLMTTQQQLILYLLISLLFEHLPKETFLAQILGECLFFVPMPLFGFKQKYLRKDKKCMFLIAFQLLFFIHYCYYSYCYRVRRSQIRYNYCATWVRAVLTCWVRLSNSAGQQQDLQGIVQPYGNKDLLWRFPRWELLCFYRFQHQTSKETWSHLVTGILSTGRRACTSNHRYKC